jgi:hypothetical protein
MIVERPSRRYRLEKEAAFECLPIVFLERNESAIFVEVFEKSQVAVKT